MMLIKVIMKDDEVTTRINGSLREIAEHYFIDPDVVSIKILECEPFENEYYRSTTTEIYRASEEDIEKFQLCYNIRYRYKIEYLESQAEDCETSAGLCDIQ